MRVLEGHTGPVRCLAYAPDGQALASGGDDLLAVHRLAVDHHLDRHLSRVADAGALQVPERLVVPAPLADRLRLVRRLRLQERRDLRRDLDLARHLQTQLAALHAHVHVVDAEVK